MFKKGESSPKSLPNNKNGDRKEQLRSKGGSGLDNVSHETG